ncbi:hypothetical protein FRB97_001221 [Tulasnella sp. 331]|nr:hypothetical protein FRB97_001221 [Tulasnella sp. 331]
MAERGASATLSLRTINAYVYCTGGKLWQRLRVDSVEHLVGVGPNTQLRLMTRVRESWIEFVSRPIPSPHLLTAAVCLSDATLMKRVADNNAIQERGLSKMPQIASEGMSRPMSRPVTTPFAAADETPLTDIHVILENGKPYALSDRWITGKVDMQWASAPGGIQRFLLNTAEIKFVGSKENLPAIASSVKLSLKGALLDTSKKTSLKIQYVGGILMQETKKSGEVIETDLCASLFVVNDSHELDSGICEVPNEDWFCTPLEAVGPQGPMEQELPSEPTPAIRDPGFAHEENIGSLPTPERSPTPPSKATEPTRRAHQNQKAARDIAGDDGSNRGQLRQNGELDHAAGREAVGKAVRQIEVPAAFSVQHDQLKITLAQSTSKQAVKDSALNGSNNPSLPRTSTDLKQTLFTKQKPIVGPSSVATSRNASLSRSAEPGYASIQADTSIKNKRRASVEADSPENDQRNGFKKRRRDREDSKPLIVNAVPGPSREPTVRSSLDADKAPFQSEKRDNRKKKKRHDKIKSGSKTMSTLAAVAVVPNSPLPPVPAPLTKIEVHPPAKGPSRIRKKKEATKAAQEMQAGYICPQSRPGQYCPLNQLKDKAKVCFAGIVVEISEPRLTATGDLQLLVSLVDPSWRDAENIVTIQCFAPGGQPVFLPVVKLGEPLLLRSVKIQEFHGRPAGIAYKGDYTWVCYNTSGHGQAEYNQEGCPPNAWAPTEADTHYLHNLCRWWAVSEAKLTPIVRALINKKTKSQDRMSIGGPAESLTPVSTRTEGSVPSRRHTKRGPCLIRDVEPGDFFDCVVRITEFGMDQGLFSTMFVTDYTRHRDMFAGSADRTLKISLWERDREEAFKLTPDWYHLRNVFAKVDKEGKIEGQMRSHDGGSFKRLQKSSREVQELLRRKAKLDDDPEYNDWVALGTGIRPSERGAHWAGDTAVIARDVVAVEAIVHPSTSELVRNLWARGSSAKFTPLSEMTLKESEPRKFRVAVQVMEFFPQDLRQWISAFCSACQQSLPEDHQRCVECNDDLGDALKLSYRFVLRVRGDQGSVIDILVAGQHGVNFLSAFRPKFLDTREDLKIFTEYVSPILNKRDEANDEIPGPLIDVCVKGLIVGKDSVYHLFGTELDVL